MGTIGWPNFGLSPRSSRPPGPPVVLVCILDEGSKRALNSRLHRSQRLSDNRIEIPIISPRDKGWEHSVASVFKGFEVFFYPDAVSRKAKGVVGSTIGMFSEAFSAWEESCPRLLALGFTLENEKKLVTYVQLVADFTESGASVEVTASSTEQKPVSREKPAFRSSFYKVIGFWPRDNSGIPYAWNAVPLWCQEQMLQAYKCDLATLGVEKCDYAADLKK